MPMLTRLQLKKYLVFLLMIGLPCFTQPIQAQSDAGLIRALNAIRASLDAMVKTTANYIFQTPPNIGAVLVTHNTKNEAVKTIAPNIKTLNDQDIRNGLVPNIKNPNAALVQMASIQASDTVLSSSLVGGVPPPFYSSASQQRMQDALTLGNENLNFQSLIAPLTYKTTDQQNNALNYLRFVSGYAIPISSLSLNSYTEAQLSLKQKLNLQNTASYQTFQVQRRTLLALQSVALTNLYRIYSKRIPIKTIHAGDTALGTEAPSAGEIENYLATWRTSSPTWYTQMATASPATVGRETLFILAEIQAELHRIHQDNERMIAMTAVNIISIIQAGKQQLAITEKQVQDQIDDLIKANAAKGTTSQTVAQPGETPRQQSEAQQLKQQQQKVTGARPPGT